MRKFPLMRSKKLDPMTQREEWKQLRESGLGGSDAGSICGVNTYSSGLEVFFSKVGELPEKEDNELMEWGRTLEPVIADKFTKKTFDELLPGAILGKDTCFTVTDPDCVYCHPEHTFLFANPDRMLYHPGLGDGILEIKTSNEYNYSDWMEGNIPQSYILQVQHYMYVMDCNYSFIAALIGGNKFRTFYIPRDEDVIQPMLEQEIAFWERVLQYKKYKNFLDINPCSGEADFFRQRMEEVKPPLRYGEDASRLIKSMYPVAISDTMKDLPEYLSDAEQWASWRDIAKEAEDKKKFYAQKIQAAMGTSEKAAIGKYTAEYPTRNRSGYTVEPTTYRQFTIKEPKIKNLRG